MPLFSFRLPVASASAPQNSLAASDTAKGLQTEILSLPDQAEEITREVYNWLRTDSLGALAGVALGVGLYFALILTRGWFRRRLARYGNVGSWGWIALRVVARTRSFFLVTASAMAVSRLFEAPGAVTAFVTFLFTISAAVQGAFWAREFLIALVERKSAVLEPDATITSAVGVLTVLINVVVWAITGVILLDNLGVNVTGLVAGLGIGGIAIGLAAQGIFSDLFAALSILLDRPFKNGDTIQVGGPQGVIGTVEHIGLKTTRLRALSGEIVVLSNANMLSQQINNFAAYEQRRVVTALGVTYQTPAAMLAQLPAELEKIVGARERCRFDRAHFVSFGAFSLDFELVYFVKDAGLLAMMEERQAIGIAVLKRFEELDVEFAYPTQVEMLAGPDGKVIDPREDAPASKRSVRTRAEKAEKGGAGRTLRSPT